MLEVVAGIIPVVNVTICKIDAATGRIVGVVRRHNLVPTAGRNLLRDFLAGDGPAALSHVALGTGTTTPAATDTALQAEVFRDVITQRIKDTAKLTVKYYLGTQYANGYTLAEAGLFNAATGGVMYARVTFPPDAKTVSQAWTFTWDLTFSV